MSFVVSQPWQPNKNPPTIGESIEISAKWELFGLKAETPSKAQMRFKCLLNRWTDASYKDECRTPVYPADVINC